MTNRARDICKSTRERVPRRVDCNSNFSCPSILVSPPSNQLNFSHCPPPSLHSTISSSSYRSSFDRLSLEDIQPSSHRAERASRFRSPLIRTIMFVYKRGQYSFDHISTQVEPVTGPLPNTIEYIPGGLFLRHCPVTTAPPG